MAKARELEKPQEAQQKALAQTKTNHMHGVVGIEPEDILLPKIILMQGLSKWVQEQKAKAGQFVNSLTVKVIEDTTFVPAAITKYYEGLRYEGTKAIVEFKTTNKNDERLEGRSFWANRETGEKASAQTSLFCVGLFAGRPLAFAFTKTSYKAGKKFISLLQYAERPIYELRYKLASNVEKNDKGTFYVLDIEQLEESSQDERNAAKTFQETFLPHVAKVAEKTVGDEEAVPF